MKNLKPLFLTVILAGISFFNYSCSKKDTTTTGQSGTTSVQQPNQLPTLSVSLGNITSVIPSETISFSISGTSNTSSNSALVLLHVKQINSGVIVSDSPIHISGSNFSLNYPFHVSPDAQPGTSISFAAELTDAAGKVTTQNITINVVDPIVISITPTDDQKVTLGQTINYNVSIKAVDNSILGMVNVNVYDSNAHGMFEYYSSNQSNADSVTYTRTYPVSPNPSFVSKGDVLILEVEANGSLGAKQFNTVSARRRVLVQ